MRKWGNNFILGSLGFYGRVVKIINGFYLVGFLGVCLVGNVIFGILNIDEVSEIFVF